MTRFAAQKIDLEAKTGRNGQEKPTAKAKSPATNTKTLVNGQFAS